jgi:exopolysaccharide biosynthesis polyprenyl glycosylphosphotransferase
LLIFGESRFRRRVVILGAGWAGKNIFQALNESGKSLYQLVGFVDDDHEKIGSVVDVDESINEELLTHPACLTVIGRQKHLLDIVARYRVTTIVLAITEDIPGELYQILADCLQYGVEILPMTVLYEELTGKVPVEHLGDQWSVSMPLEHPGTQLVWSAAKRGFDLIWSSLGLIILGLLFPWIVLAIKIDSRGPIFYTQERVGRHGKKFTVHKFRSMVVDAETDQEIWAEKNDPRITRIGKILRLTHLDEFPQFWNILKGDMSVVGPRPERPEFVERLAQEIPFYRVRLAVKPGMAGWALIHQGYGGSVEDTLVKLQYDLYYIKHQSLWLDLFILGRTIIDALTLGGR